MRSRWTQVTASEFPWEKEALAFLKDGLPDREPYAAWSNFEFIHNGTISEVDALVVAPKGVFLIEIKSWPGLLEGDAGTWRTTRPGTNRTRRFDNPLLLTNRKAKRLKSLLAHQRAFRGERAPFIIPLVFLSHPELDCRLSPDGRTGVHGLDGTRSEPSPQRGGLTGILAALTGMTADDRQRLGDRRVDRPMAERISQAFEQAGIRRSRQQRLVADLELGELIDEGRGFQDFEAANPHFKHAHRRVRIYGASDKAGPEERTQGLRAAQREFELLSPVSHPGIVRALSFHEHELGPAIVFDRDPGETRLDHHLEQAGPSLDLEARIGLVRELAETIAFAHGRRLFHRALSPRSIHVVRAEQPDRHCVIGDWQTGTRAAGGTLSLTIEGTRHVEQLVDEQAAAYLAPEALTQPEAEPELLDVFSLGAIAFHIFTGQPPATTLSGLVARLQRDGALEVAGALDGAGPALTDLVREATAADASQRIESVADFLAGLDLIEEELTTPTEVPEPDPSPLEARRGDTLHGYRVVRRLGRGSTAIALLVTDPDGRERVLKVAADLDKNERVHEEWAVLDRLRDRTIIAAYGEPVDLAGHAAIVLEYAAGGTLAKRLHEEGALGLEALQRWGTDLLSALDYLERIGIPHRDIKPANLGIVELGPRRQLQLVLMDFSLARAPIDQIRAGTPPYLDPFLGSGRRTRWDLAADRYAVAMVLHEMAAGSRPEWGDGQSNPQFAGVEVTVGRDAFPRDLAGPLTDFFERGLRADASRRFDTAEDMLRAWRQMFEQLDRVDETRVDSPEHVGELRRNARFETPLDAIGLSTRAANALERASASRVEDLLSMRPSELKRLRGVGTKTRRELLAAQQDLSPLLDSPAAPPRRAATMAEEPDGQSLDALLKHALPRETARNATELRALRLLLGLEPLDVQSGDWPSQTDVAGPLDVTRARVGQILAKARRRWLRLPAVTQLRNEVVEVLDRLGGIAGSAELGRELLAERGTTGELPGEALAGAAARIAIEVELGCEEPRLSQRRIGARVVLASAGATAEERQRTLEYAFRLGLAADQLAGDDPLPGPVQVAERLSRLGMPSWLMLTPERRVAIAVAASQTAAVSGRLELYPRGMAATRALRLARGALRGKEQLDEAEMRRLVAARFPDAEPLPSRPELDRLIDEHGIAFGYDERDHTYRVPNRDRLTGLSASESPDRLTTAHTVRPAPTDPETNAAAAFEQRLQTAIADGGLLSLMAYPRDVSRAARELRRFDVTPIDLDALVLGQLRAAADGARVRWDVVLTADGADRGSVDWSRVMTLVTRAMPAVEQEIVTTPGVVLLENPGLLARYGQMSLVDRLREAAMGEQPLHGAWILLPASDQEERPMLDGSAVPVQTTNEWLRVPYAWLENRHRAKEAA